MVSRNLRAIRFLSKRAAPLALLWGPLVGLAILQDALVNLIFVPHRPVFGQSGLIEGGLTAALGQLGRTRETHAAVKGLLKKIPDFAEHAWEELDK